MKPLIVLFAIVLGLATAVLAYRALVGGDGGTPGQPPVARESGPDADEEYWTPERLRDAKPIELPHPEGPPEAAEPPDVSPPDEAASESGAGHLGEGDVPPDETNILVPPDGTPDDDPTPH